MCRCTAVGPFSLPSLACDFFWGQCSSRCLNTHFSSTACSRSSLTSHNPNTIIMLLFGCSTTLVVVLHCFYGLSQSIQLWSSPGALPTSIPASCRAELSKNITCSPILVSPQFAAGGRAMDPETAAQYCTPTCYNSLKVRRRIATVQLIVA